jgi:hypothetical protein
MVLSRSGESGFAPSFEHGLRVQREVTLWGLKKGKDFGYPGSLQKLGFDASAIKKFCHGCQCLKMELSLVWRGKNQKKKIHQLAVYGLAIDALRASSEQKAWFC